MNVHGAAEEIAIVGIGCLFPGAQNPAEFWDLLINGRTGIVELNERDLGKPVSWYFDPAKGTKDKMCNTRKGIVNDFAFDPFGYRLAPNVLNGLDDLFKWTLEACKQALNDAGCYPTHRLLPRTGVILGNVCFTTKQMFDSVEPLYADIVAEALRESGRAISPFVDPESNQLDPGPDGIIFSYPAVIAAKALAMGGPCFALDAACASSLYSICLACDCLRAGDADMMLAGGSCVAAHMVDSIVFNTLGVTDGSHPCLPLDQDSEGIVSGEGSGIVVLKRLSDAIRDGDDVYAVIEGVGLSNDGGEKHLLAPARNGQIASFERAYGNGGISREVDYIECHATGTKVGDQVELNSMEEYFGSASIRPRFGAVKGNVGHLLSAAGVAGLIKVLLSLKHGEIPPTFGVTHPLSSERGTFGVENIVARRSPWPAREQARRAAVNSFGFGGTDAHLVLRDRVGPIPEPCAPAGLVAVGITGMGARFGNIAGIREFRNAIYHGRANFIPRPDNRWLGMDRRHALLAKYGLDCVNAQRGSYIDEVELDFLRHKISPAENPVPLMRDLVMLNVAEQALTDAGLVKGKDRNVAVIIGTEYDILKNRYVDRSELRVRFSAVPGLWEELGETLKDMIGPDPSAHSMLGKITNILANRISASWGFTGPSFVMGAMENTVPKILQVAQRMLSFGRVDAVLVGAIDLQGEFENVLTYNRLHPGEREFMIGEGAGALVLKRIDHIAASDGNCYATIDATSVRESQSPTFASGIDTAAIRQCAAEALALSSITAASIGYVELSGGGGDADASAESEVLAECYGGDESCICAGNVKRNVGANIVASGIAGLMKAALCLHGRFIPAEIPSPISAGRESRPWRRRGTRRYAAINSFGFDGACAHVILAEPDPKPRPKRGFLGNFEQRVFVATGRGEARLLADLRELKRELESGSRLEWLAADRYRRYGEIKRDEGLLIAVIVGKSLREILDATDQAISEIPACIASGRNWSLKNGSCCTVEPMRGKGKLAFVYPLGVADEADTIEKYLYLFPENDDDAVMRQQITGRLNAHILGEYFNIVPDVVFGCACIAEQADFAGFVRKTYEDGVRVYIDVGPQNHCSRWISDALGDTQHLSLAVNGESESGETEILTLLASMLSARLDPDISRLFDERLLAQSGRSLVKRTAFHYRDAFKALPATTHASVSNSASGPSAKAGYPARAPVNPVVGTRRVAAVAAHGAKAAAKLARIQGSYLSLQSAFYQKMLNAMSVAADTFAPALGSTPAFALASGFTPASVHAPAAPAFTPKFVPTLAPAPALAPAPCVWDERQILEMTEGRLSAVLGSEYADVDDHPVRQRVPSPPFMFVSRVTKVTATRNRYVPCSLETEYDTTEDAWYVLDGQVIDLVGHESSHSLLLMLSYIGVDREFGFKLRYRITDTETTYFDDYVVRPGNLLRNVIGVKSFIKTSDKLIVFYEHECFCRDALLFRSLGTGGMFSASDLAGSKGIAVTPRPKVSSKGASHSGLGRPAGTIEAPACDKRSFTDDDLRELKQGRPERCFGAGYVNYSGRACFLCNDMQDMLDRVTLIDLAGGNYGTGFVVGEKDITADHWAFRAHFKNDPVLPGNLMLDGAGQLMQFFMHFMGFYCRNQDSDWIARPVTRNAVKSSFRGQVPMAATTLRTVLHVREVNHSRDVSVIGDVEVFIGEKRILTVRNAGLALRQRTINGGRK